MSVCMAVFSVECRLMVLASCALVCKLQAGGSGLNTVVVVNQTSSNSCELGNYFCERRQVPPQNVLYINWSGGNTLWTSNDFQTNLVIPLLNMLAARQLTNQIDYVVLSMDIPFQTSFGSSCQQHDLGFVLRLKAGQRERSFGCHQQLRCQRGESSARRHPSARPAIPFSPP